MSYPYGGGNPGYPGAPGGYPAPGGAPGYPQPGGGPPGGYPGYNQPQQQMGMPTPESASAAAYGQPGGGLPYGTAPPGGAPGALGFNVGGAPPPQPAYPQGGPPMGQPGYPQAGAPPGPGYPQAPGVGMPAPAGQGQPPYQQNPPYGASPAYNTPIPPQGGYGQPPGPGYPGAQPTGGYPASTASGYPGSQPNPGYQSAGAPGYQGQTPGQSAPGGMAPGSTPAGGAHQYKVKTEGTLKPFANFNAEADAKVLRKAMKGFGTDEKAIIDVLAYRTSDQRQQIKTMFKTCFGKDLIKDLKSELGGNFEDVILALMMKPDEYDAYEMKRAMRGVGTDEDAMIEILCSRTNKEIQAINVAYKAMYRSTMEKDIISDTSGHFKRLMVSMANGGRQENQAVDMNKAQQDAQRLYQAGEKRLGTDESAFNAIMASQSFEQLRAVFDHYNRISGHDIEQAIKREMSGNLELGMLAIVRCVRNRSAYFAEKLYKSMKGLGTDDKTLIRCIVTRAEVDMVQIKQEFQKIYGQSLEAFIRDDTSGDYRRVLLALVTGTYRY